MEEEQRLLSMRSAPQWQLPFIPAFTSNSTLAAKGEQVTCTSFDFNTVGRFALYPYLHSRTFMLCMLPAGLVADKVRVAVIREEGSNGDREMAAAVWYAGMEPWDVTMSDLLNGRASLDSFQGEGIGALVCVHACMSTS